MAFIRRRGNSHQLLLSYRCGRTVKHRCLANLGPCDTLEAAWQWWDERAREYYEELEGLLPTARRFDGSQRALPNPQLGVVLDKLRKRISTLRQQFTKAIRHRDAAIAMIDVFPPTRPEITREGSTTHA